MEVHKKNHEKPQSKRLGAPEWAARNLSVWYTMKHKQQSVNNADKKKKTEVGYFYFNSGCGTLYLGWKLQPKSGVKVKSRGKRTPYAVHTFCSKRSIKRFHYAEKEAVRTVSAVWQYTARRIGAYYEKELKDEEG